MSRPLGLKARAILNTLERQPLPVSQLAVQLQLSRRDAVYQVRNLLRAGYVRYGEPLPRAGRPARLVEPVPAPGEGWQPLSQVWR
jgi:predicted ArsR family transcriptional regulator